MDPSGYHKINPVFLSYCSDPSWRLIVVSLYFCCLFTHRCPWPLGQEIRQYVYIQPVTEPDFKTFPKLSLLWMLNFHVFSWVGILFTHAQFSWSSRSFCSRQFLLLTCNDFNFFFSLNNTETRTVPKYCMCYEIASLVWNLDI